jgi:hypothetical protein
MFPAGVYLNITGGGMIYTTKPQTTHIEAYKVTNSENVNINDIYIYPHDSTMRLTVLKIMNDSNGTIILGRSRKYDLFNRASAEIGNTSVDIHRKLIITPFKKSQRIIKIDQNITVFPILNLSTDTIIEGPPIFNKDIEIDDDEFDSLINDVYQLKRQKC